MIVGYRNYTTYDYSVCDYIGGIYHVPLMHWREVYRNNYCISIAPDTLWLSTDSRKTYVMYPMEIVKC